MAYQSVLVTFDKSPVKVDVSLPLVGPQGAQGPKGDKGDTGEFSGTLDDNLEITDPTKGLILRSDNGTRYLFTVENNGQLKRVALAIIASVIMFWPSKLFAQYDVLVDSNGLITAPTNFLNANGIPTLGGNNTFSGTNTFSTLRTTQTNVMLGMGASASGGGGAIGNGTVVHGGGGAAGNGAYVDDGGGAIGRNAYAEVGGAIGNNAYAVVGGAIGYNTYADGGGAIGENAKSSGYGVQLSTGTNSTDNTLQFLNWQVVDTNGNVPVGRFGNLFTNTNNFTADNTFGDAAGDSVTVNAGSFTAPNATNTSTGSVANVGALDGRYGRRLSVIKNVTEYRNSTTTLAADSELVFASVPVGKYAVTIFVQVYDDNYGGFAWDIGGTATKVAMSRAVCMPDIGSALWGGAVLNNPLSGQSFAPWGNSRRYAHITFTMKVTVSGSFEFRWAQQTSNPGSIQFYSGAYIILQKLD